MVRNAHPNIHIDFETKTYQWTIELMEVNKTDTVKHNMPAFTIQFDFAPAAFSLSPGL